MKRALYSFTAIVLAIVSGTHVVKAAAPSVAPGGSAPEVAGGSVEIGRGDQLLIEVFGNRDLTTTTTVEDDGTIRFPLVGAVPVESSTASAAKAIETALKDGAFLVDPHVTVTVAKSAQRVSVLGEVGAPGRYPIDAKSTVFDIIALAGGINSKGSEKIYILRVDASGSLQRLPVDLHTFIDAREKTTGPIQILKGGDSIVVPKGTFMITGQVMAPGEYRVEAQMRLFQAIAVAGGVTPMGSESRVEIRRRGADDKFVAIKGKKDSIIEPGDIIRVKERLF